MVRVVYIIAGCSGFRGKLVVRKFSFERSNARLVVDDEKVDVED